MTDENSSFDLQDPPEKQSSPWLGILLVVAVLGIAAVWVFHEKSLQTANQAVITALESEVNADQKALDSGRERLIEMTNRLETMKQVIELGQVKGKAKEKAMDDYNQLAAQQRAEREKIKALADQYNEKLAKLRQLQQ